MSFSNNRAVKLGATILSVAQLLMAGGLIASVISQRIWADSLDKCRRCFGKCSLYLLRDFQSVNIGSEAGFIIAEAAADNQMSRANQQMGIVWSWIV